jgi:hypothetical protein
VLDHRHEPQVPVPPLERVAPPQRTEDGDRERRERVPQQRLVPVAADAVQHDTAQRQ